MLYYTEAHADSLHVNPHSHGSIRNADESVIITNSNYAAVQYDSMFIRSKQLCTLTIVVVVFEACKSLPLLNAGFCEVQNWCRPLPHDNRLF